MVRGVLAGIVFAGFWATQMSFELFIPSAVAQAATAPGSAVPVSGVPAVEPPSLFGALIEMLPMLAVCYLIFYFMVIRPQERKTKQHKALVESMKRGDSVVTSSGIVGKVSGVENDHILLEIAPNVKVKFLRQHVVRLENPPQTSKAA
jgi:preprotein translocase subunit YajC